MEKDEKSLPRPLKTPFGRKRAGEDESEQELMADKMAEAAAFGNLEAFLDRELPDSEHARSLANMMMGMTGMLPQGARPSPGVPGGVVPEPSNEEAQNAPPGIRAAVQAGDVKGLIDMLRQEHLKRSEGGEEAPFREAAEAASPSEATQSVPIAEQVVLDQLIALARENNVSPDWVIQRALKLYFEEYKRTGRL
jgi:hypothetical protein